MVVKHTFGIRESIHERNCGREISKLRIPQERVKHRPTCCNPVHDLEFSREEGWRVQRCRLSGLSSEEGSRINERSGDTNEESRVPPDALCSCHRCRLLEGLASFDSGTRTR